MARKKHRPRRSHRLLPAEHRYQHVNGCHELQLRVKCGDEYEWVECYMYKAEPVTFMCKPCSSFLARKRTYTILMDVDGAAVEFYCDPSVLSHEAHPCITAQPNQKKLVTNRTVNRRRQAQVTPLENPKEPPADPTVEGAPEPGIFSFQPTGDPCTVRHLVVVNTGGICYASTAMNVLISIQGLYDYFKDGKYSDNEVNNFTKGMFDHALDSDDSERDTAAIAFDPTNLLRLIGFVDQTFFHNMNTIVFVERYLMPHYDVDVRCMFKTSSSFSVDCKACTTNTSSLHPYSVVATAQKPKTVSQLLGEFRKQRNYYRRRSPLTCPMCGNVSAAGINDVTHVPRYMLLRTRNDVNKVHPIVHFEDQFKAFGHNWRYVAASRIRPKTTLHRAHATALLFNRDLQKHYEIDGTRSTIVQAPVDISEHRFTVFERL